MPGLGPALRKEDPGPDGATRSRLLTPLSGPQGRAVSATQLRAASKHRPPAQLGLRGGLGAWRGRGLSRARRGWRGLIQKA